ncbi:MAG TPA: ABC transporter ATP-binding protein [Casimicrobiaceae bacterium]|jgi:branched-chain amino acid transport system ATP-binding protein|nr:ABC transporter ATP-binding protein [Casimicrobiaceae bacterium]
MLEVADLHAAYGDAQVLRGVSVRVDKGRIVALLGRNGMGKTTLIRSIMGMRPPHVIDGEVTFRGHSLRGLSPHQIAQRRIGLVPQGRRLFASLTVTEHLTMLGRGARSRSQWNVDRLFELFPRLGERRHHRGHQLSGGERQMLAVARALTLDPEMLLMDEPSEGLAPVMVQHLERTMVELRGLGYAILLVEQNLYSALAVADEAYILETGRIVHQAPVDSLRDDHATMHRFLGV